MMRTDIVIGRNIAGIGSNDDIGPTHKLSGDIIARIGELVYSSDKLPMLLEHPFSFEGEEVGCMYQDAGGVLAAPMGAVVSNR